MIGRRSFLGACMLPLAAPDAHAAPLADVLLRPAAPMQLASKPAMVRITRAGDRLVAVGERGIVLLSDDDGASWRQAKVPVSSSLTGVQFIDAKRGWAIGHACAVLRTLDGGETWALQYDGRQQTDGLAQPLLDLHFSDDRNGWVVGAYGLALQTADGGATWQSRGESLPNPKGLHLYAIARQGSTLYVAGEQGLFLGVAIDGRAGSAVALTTPYRGSFFTLTALADEALLFGGLRGTLLLRSAAGDFRPLDSGSSQAIVSATPLAPQRQALVDQSGRVLLGNAAQGRYVAQAGDATRRWVSVVAARDGTLVGACNIGVGRLAQLAS